MEELFVVRFLSKVSKECHLHSKIRINKLSKAIEIGNDPYELFKVGEDIKKMFSKDPCGCEVLTLVERFEPYEVKYSESPEDEEYEYEYTADDI